MTFKREHRYMVFKVIDASEALSLEEVDYLIYLGNKVAEYRELVGKKPLVAAVVESDWPEYEPTWASVQERVENKS